MIIFRQKEYTTKTIRVYHVTFIENLQSIFKYGLITNRDTGRNYEFENTLGISNKKMSETIYLSKDLDNLILPVSNNCSVVLQIDIPEDIYKKWDKVNKGDPQFIAIRKKFKSIKEATDCYCKYPMLKNPNAKKYFERMFKKYGGMEKSPYYQHILKGYETSLGPEHTLCIKENIPPEWICSEILTETKLRKMGIKLPPQVW